MKKCLICKKELNGLGDYHTQCAKTFFGCSDAPILDYKLSDINKIAQDVISDNRSVTGVQKKLSVHLSNVRDEGMRKITIVGLWGDFILKPPAEDYEFLPENEDVTMDLAELFNIKVVPHALIRFSSGELAYITRRIDRIKKHKLHMEDMCQLQERLTEDKYHSSVERIGKIIDKFSSNPGFDKQILFEVVLFSHLVGNSDMHLKNYSLLHNENGTITLAPSYDLLNVKIVLPEDKEESALTLNGKKNKLTREDFDYLADYLRIPVKAADNIYKRFKKKSNKYEEIIRNSFLSKYYQEKYLLYMSSKINDIFNN